MRSIECHDRRSKIVIPTPCGVKAEVSKTSVAYVDTPIGESGRKRRDDTRPDQQPKPERLQFGLLAVAADCG
jgi:hypothetical protein